MNSDVNMIYITLKKRLRFMLHAYCGKKHILNCGKKHIKFKTISNLYKRIVQIDHL